jgi:hypothetical protein
MIKASSDIQAYYILSLFYPLKINLFTMCLFNKDLLSIRDTADKNACTHRAYHLGGGTIINK